MSATKEKKWTPPKGWEITDQAEVGITGFKVLEDGTRREILATSEKQFELLAEQYDTGLI